MVVFDYSRIVTTATRLITKFGQDMILRIETEGDYDPATGESEVFTADHSVTGVIFELDQRMVGKSIQNDMLTESNDKQCLLKVGVSPSLFDKIIVGSNTFIILNIKEMNPGGTIVFYDLILRNG